jgi:hypothetical protein
VVLGSEELVGAVLVGAPTGASERQVHPDEVDDAEVLGPCSRLPF